VDQSARDDVPCEKQEQHAGEHDAAGSKDRVLFGPILQGRWVHMSLPRNNGFIGWILSLNGSLAKCLSDEATG
jgi:hypothetical protein